MNLTFVMLVCLGGLAACAALVFAVETAVAFLLHEAEPLASRAEVIPLQLPQADEPLEERWAA